MTSKSLLIFSAVLCTVHVAPAQSPAGMPQGTIGATLRQTYDDSVPNKRGCLIIEEVIAGYPAAEAGLHPGDCVNTVGKTAVEGKAAEEIPNLNGPVGTSVTFFIERAGTRKFGIAVNMVRRPIPAAWAATHTPSASAPVGQSSNTGGLSAEEIYKTSRRLEMEAPAAYSAPSSPQPESSQPQAQPAPAYQPSPVAGHWSSVAFNRDFEYNFAPDGTYEFAKTSLFGSARLTISGRGTYQVSGSALYCHQTEVDSAGSPGRLMDETWSFSGGSLSMNGLTMTR